MSMVRSAMRSGLLVARSRAHARYRGNANALLSFSTLEQRAERIQRTPYSASAGTPPPRKAEPGYEEHGIGTVAVGAAQLTDQAKEARVLAGFQGKIKVMAVETRRSNAVRAEEALRRLKALKQRYEAEKGVARDAKVGAREGGEVLAEAGRVAKAPESMSIEDVVRTVSGTVRPPGELAGRDVATGKSAGVVRYHGAIDKQPRLKFELGRVVKQDTVAPLSRLRVGASSGKPTFRRLNLDGLVEVPGRTNAVSETFATLKTHTRISTSSLSPPATSSQKRGISTLCRRSSLHNSTAPSSNRAIRTTYSKHREVTTRPAHPFTHLDRAGRAHMVDVANKPTTKRHALASSHVYFTTPDTWSLVRDSQLAKGDVLSTARIAGIQAAKRTHELIPLCHQLALTHVSVDLTVVPPDTSVGDRSSSGGVGAEQGIGLTTKQNGGRFGAVRIDTRVECLGQTGVEMEALTAAQVAGLTVYDMCKALDKGMVLGPTVLLRKAGGKSGTYERSVSEFKV